MERNNADPRVDAYIHALPAWQQGICEKVRDLVHAADSEVRETIKRTRQPYFVLHGNICTLLAARKWVNVFLYDGGIVPTLTASSRAGTTTRRPAQWRSGRATPSTSVPLRRCSGGSLRTTERAGGEHSKPAGRAAEFASAYNFF